jgi:hypothetical protein
MMEHLPVRQSDFAAALLDPTLAVPSGVVSHRGDSDSKRFAVYRNNVHVGLLGVLAARFPVCARLVGEDFFMAMARIYVAQHKPISPIMMHYGDAFPTFIAGFAAARSVPYLSDVASLEAAWSVAYNAADIATLGLAELAGTDSAGLSALGLQRHPATGLVRSNFPVGSIWSAHQSEGVAVRAGSEAVLISRPTLDVKVTVIPVSDAAFVSDLFAGVSIGFAAERTLITYPDFDLPRALAGLCLLGAFSKPVAG